MPAPPRIAVFAPDPLLSVVVEERPGGGDEVHLHPGGQGVWLSRMAAELGGHPILCGFVGGETGAVLEGLLASIGGERRLVAAGTTGAYVADRRSGERRLVAHATAPPPSRHEVDELLSVTAAAALEADALVLCNPYPADHVPPGVYAELTADVRANGTPVYADLSTPRLDSALQGSPDLIKLNDWELAETVSGPVDGPLLQQAAEGLLERGARIVVVTRGEQPAVVFGTPAPLEVVPPVFERGFREGCGDSMMGAMSVALTSGAALEEALTLGAAAGAANFLRRGLGSADRTVVEQLRARVEVRPYTPGG